MPVRSISLPTKQLFIKTMVDEKTLSGNGEEASPRALSSVALNYIPIVCGISSNRLHIIYLNMLIFTDSVVEQSLATIETLLKALGNLKT